MLHTSPTSQVDPIVEILRLAYRRGLVWREEQERQAAENAKILSWLEIDPNAAGKETESCPQADK